VLKVTDPDDILWIHDYQLLLLPGLIRAVLPDITIGFFQHIPFPSYELYRLIPWRVELLEGMMGADLVGFHTFDDARHFVQSSRRLMSSVISSFNEINYRNRSTIVDSFPMGIDSRKFDALVSTDAVTEQMELIDSNFRNI